MDRIKPLHNFDLPCFKWGNQKLLRCINVDSNADMSTVDRDHRKFSSSEKMKAIDGDIEATREKLMFDFQTEMGKMKDEILNKRCRVDPPPEIERTWNLRTRRAGGKNPSPVNGNYDDCLPVREECKRRKFSVAVSRRELEEDFVAMTGRRLPRKPKRRPRVIQKQLDTLFPGLWLTEITADLYRVPDHPETGKR